MIQLRNVSKSFGAKQVLCDISLQLAAASTHIILGSSGCGKSTLVRIILGLMQEDSGEVQLGELAANSRARGALAAADISGYVIQDGGLFPHLTAKQNIFLRAQTFALVTPDLQTRYEKLMQDFHLDLSLENQYPAQLSGGQRQRIGLIRALLLDPEYLFLDEPLSALDPIVRAHLQEELKQVFASRQKTVVLVTHDIVEAAYLSDTVTLMNQGKIEQHGTFRDLLDRPSSTFVTEFINAQRTEQMF